MPRAALTAVLGPTNTGKTHLAIERMCAHSSGIMGFPLRLLAREVYERVRAIKGDAAVALVTGEEKIVPPDARWLICTVESMPVERDVAFVAIDEAQLGADAERGHVFTDRLLHARGREETMILGSASLTPLIRALLPEAEIVGRPRFSQLSYTGPKKLSRLPDRSAIVAFSAEEVYSIAETIRRTRGGSAVVMGALSPRTRNAQVAMFESGEVDYLVATDAIGMGLNLNLGHVAFAGLSKFDGTRQRRLRPAEMAQIAGRAGRHQRDGTFGILSSGERTPEFMDVEIDRIENHRFATLDHLYWRNAAPDFSGLEELIESLELRPERVELRPAPESVDLAVLKALAKDPSVRHSASGKIQLQRLWEVCGLPDFRQMGAEFHARLVGRLFGYLVGGQGIIPHDLVATELARLDNIQGDIGTLTGRIASTRIWSYVCQRKDWLADPGHWAGRAGVLEEKLSDALHDKLTQRFVDRRTTLLMRNGGDQATFQVEFREEGEVMLDDEHLGWLRGFSLEIDSAARLGDRKKLVAAVERRLPRELAKRAEWLEAAPDREFSLKTEPGLPVEIAWRGHKVARLEKGRTIIAPLVRLDRTLRALPAELQARIVHRVEDWVKRQVAGRLAPLQKLHSLSSNPLTPSSLRAVAAPLLSTAGVISRMSVELGVNGLSPEDRRSLRQAGITIGALDLFHPALLKPEATRLRLALLASYTQQSMPPVPMPGLTLLDRPSAALAAGATNAGFRRFGEQMVRIDMVERIARALHDQRQGKSAFVPEMHLATQIGVGEATLRRIMRALGFYPSEKPAPGTWRWRGRERTKIERHPKGTSFEALKDWSPRGPI